MAKVKLNPALEQLRGKIGDMVFRQVRGKLVVSRAPDFSRRKLSDKQRAQCRRFKDAVRHAKSVLANPGSKAASAARARAKSRPLMGQLISEYFKSCPAGTEKGK